MKKTIVEDQQRPIHVFKATKIHSGCALLICHLVCEHYGPYFFPFEIILDCENTMVLIYEKEAFSPLKYLHYTCKQYILW